MVVRDVFEKIEQYFKLFSYNYKNSNSNSWIFRDLNDNFGTEVSIPGWKTLYVFSLLLTHQTHVKSLLKLSQSSISFSTPPHTCTTSTTYKHRVFAKSLPNLSALTYTINVYYSTHPIVFDHAHACTCTHQISLIIPPLHVYNICKSKKI